MALFKSCTKLMPTLLLKNSTQLCIRAKHKEVRPYLYLWRASPKTPSTPEEIKEAAAKYNLHPTEYKPYPSEECYGDYPDLPYIGAEARDPYYPWDFPSIRRNFGEPLHIQADQIGEDRHAAGVKEMITMKGAVIMFCTASLIYSLLFLLGHIYPWFQPVMEKQYPKPGVTHYSFEPSH